MNKKLLITGCLITFLILTTGVFAITSPVSIDSEIINDQIKSNETAEYLIFVENLMSQTDTIKIDHDFLKWQVTVTPYIIPLSGHETKVSSIRISPPSNIDKGSYSLTLKFKSRNYPNIIKKDTLVVTITENVNRDPIDISFNLPSEIKAGTNEFTYTLKNNNNEFVEDINISIESSALLEPYKYDLFELAPKEEKIIEGELKIADKDPQNYYLTVRIESQGKELNSKEIKFELDKEIKEETQKVNLIKTKNEGFLKEEHIIKIENIGNIKAKKELKTTIGSIEKYFVSYNPQPTAKNELSTGEEELFWIYSVNPGETTEITYTVSYQKVFVAIIIITVIMVLAYLYLREDVTLNKKIIMTKDKNNKKYIKIMLQIKNNTGKPLKNITLVDWIKTPLTLVEKFDTLHPTLIKKKGNKVKLNWNIHTLSAREEKVISYGIKSKLKIVGSLKLPKAVLKDRKKGKIRKFWSDSPLIMGKE